MKRNKIDSSVFHLAVLISSFTLAVLLFSCKSDTTTGPPGGGPSSNDSLIFQKDSLVLRSTTNDSLHYIFSTVFHDSLRFEFEGLTNIDSSKANLGVGVYINDDSTINISNLYVVYYSFSTVDLNRTHTHFCNNSYNPLFIHFYMRIFNTLLSDPKYIILKNIKVYKVKT